MNLNWCACISDKGARFGIWLCFAWVCIFSALDSLGLLSATALYSLIAFTASTRSAFESTFVLVVASRFAFVRFQVSNRCNIDCTRSAIGVRASSIFCAFSTIEKHTGTAAHNSVPATRSGDILYIEAPLLYCTGSTEGRPQGHPLIQHGHSTGLDSKFAIATGTPAVRY